MQKEMIFVHLLDTRELCSHYVQGVARNCVDATNETVIWSKAGNTRAGRDNNNDYSCYAITAKQTAWGLYSEGCIQGFASWCKM